ncbi:MAG: LOG family protein [Nanoarchaeota archaeon]|nr:LOG family protein [Nanoarchaeota archaeon]
MEKKLIEKLKKDSFRVTIFGSARIKRGTLIYNQVRTLARLLGERGIDVVTGGGPGLMEAANQGHKKGSKKTGARSIGIGIKLPREQTFNKHLDIKKEFKRFSRRLDVFMALSNVVVVAPGGVGTLLELFYTWQLVQVKRIHNIPIIMLGRQWPALMKWFEKYPLKSKFFEKKDINLLFLAKDCSETIKMIDKAHEMYQKKGKDFRLNNKRYKL